MSRTRAPRGLWLAGGYLGLVVSSAAYLAYRLAFAPTNSEFAGMPLLLLSLPWSDWFAPVAGESGVLGWLGLLGGVGLNAGALCLISRGLARVASVAGPDVG